MHTQLCTGAFSAPLPAGCCSGLFPQVCIKTSTPDLKVGLGLGITRLESFISERCPLGSLLCSQGSAHLEGKTGIKELLWPWKQLVQAKTTLQSPFNLPTPHPPPIPGAQWLSPETRAHLVEQIFKVQLQVAEHARWQGKPWKGVGQAALQVSAERPAAEVLQRPGLLHQSEEGRVESTVLLETDGEDSVRTALGSRHTLLTG